MLFCLSRIRLGILEAVEGISGMACVCLVFLGAVFPLPSGSFPLGPSPQNN